MIEQRDQVEPGQKLVIDTFRPEDAEGVVHLFKTVYGDGYPIKLVYSPTDLISAFEAKENVPAVARTENGDVVGYVSIYRSSPNPKLYEAGQGLVLPSYRGLDISPAMGRHLDKVLVPHFDVDVLFGEAVCNHILMQKAWATVMGRGNLETAIEVDLMPAEAYTEEKSASGRVAVLSMFKTYRSKPHAVYLPGLYREQLEYIYTNVDDQRKFSTSSEGIPAGAETSQNTQIFDFAKVARVAFHSCGRDFEKVVSRMDEEFTSRGIVVTQAWLKLSEPWIGQITEILRKRGYFFGGLLPRWFDEDGILMQKVKGKPNWEGIHLYSDSAKQILEFIRADWSEIAS